MTTFVKNNKALVMLNKVNLSLAYLISQLETYGTIGKVMLVAILSTILSPLIYSAQRFIDVNVDYVLLWFIFLLADMVTGLMKHWKTKTISFRDFMLKTMEKVFVSFCGLSVFSAFALSFASESFIEHYLIMFGQISISVYIGGSALTNMYVITRGKFPPIAFMERLKNFNKDGVIEGLTKNKND